MCLQLFARDYRVQVCCWLCCTGVFRDSAVPYLSQTIDNKDGYLCAHYLASILVLQDQGEQRWECNSVYLDTLAVIVVICIFFQRRSACTDAGRLWELMQAARKARVFCRFVVPVIHYKGRVSMEREFFSRRRETLKACCLSSSRTSAGLPLCPLLLKCTVAVEWTGSFQVCYVFVAFSCWFTLACRPCSIM